MTTQHKWVMRMGCALRKLTHTCLPTPPPITHITHAQQIIKQAYTIIMQMDAKYDRQINKYTNTFNTTQSNATRTLNKHRIITLTQARNKLHKYLTLLNTLQHHITLLTCFRKLVFIFITLQLSSYLTLPPHCIIVRLNYGVDILSQMFFPIPR